MTLVTLDVTGQSAEAAGHPTNCTEPAPGEVSQFESETNSVTVTNASGEQERLATLADANLFFPTHAHDYSVDLGCHDNAEHKLLPKEADTASSITINGSPVFLTGDGVTTDPKTGGSVNIINAGINNSLNKT